ncbi:hypothetical protein SCLCIDRAFT_444425 [Scleroderma citrinum Foug A]|uniref:Uncharacterized protein n=1 Tax=Scleroderma citrinum Foug A TaxID=1036808 RepID=A0A0C3AL70_9AGAM|nr:hypothetical protein SCLCIDRAFT_444425 [Scleroderma citrinum Foug A]
MCSAHPISGIVASAAVVQSPGPSCGIDPLVHSGTRAISHVFCVQVGSIVLSQMATDGSTPDKQQISRIRLVDDEGSTDYGRKCEESLVKPIFT